MKITINQIKTEINSHFAMLQKNYNVKNLGVFGSVAREENTEQSDIDMLVEFSKPISMFHFIELTESLSKILGKKVNLVTKNP